MSILDKILGVFSGHKNAASVPSGRVIDRVLVGEALVIEDMDLKNVAHIELIMGPKGSAAERAFTRTLTTQREGVNALLAIVAPNMMAKPATVMFNKVTIKNGKQAVQMFGPAQRGVSMAVMDSVADGTIPQAESDDVFICVGVFIDSKADDDKKIQEWNYQATKQAIKNAVQREPQLVDVLENYKTSSHPFQAK
ncbi:MAG TPA: formaldehyde-activating enzyme [Methylophilaceae bacterium]|nr:formaldehyde-activating enzyme [Methylophilaceae bacterium]